MDPKFKPTKNAFNMNYYLFSGYVFGLSTAQIYSLTHTCSSIHAVIGIHNCCILRISPTCSHKLVGIHFCLSTVVVAPFYINSVPFVSWHVYHSAFVPFLHMLEPEPAECTLRLGCSLRWGLELVRYLWMLQRHPKSRKKHVAHRGKNHLAGTFLKFQIHGPILSMMFHQWAQQNCQYNGW